MSEPNWKALGLHLLNCLAATATGFPKSVSQYERRRHLSILQTALDMVEGKMTQYDSDSQKQDWIVGRAKDAVNYLASQARP